MPEGVDLFGSTAGLAWGALLAGLAAVLLSALSALVERSGPIRLRHWSEEAGGALRDLHDHPARLESYRSLLASLAKLVPVLFFLLLANLFAVLGWAASVRGAAFEAGLVTALVLLVAEVVNRYLVGWSPERALERLTGTYRTLLVLLTPLVMVLAPLLPVGGWERRTEPEEDDEVSEEEIEAFIAVGTREGILEPGEEDLVWGIVDFSDTAVRSVMTPRIDIEAAPVDSGLEAVSERFIESGHSRLPLYQGSVDHVVGILHIRDLLRALHLPAGERPRPRKLAKAPFFVPETKPLGQLLKELQARYQQMAIVVDEYGGTAGLVTVEDLVEEIVGELVDEHEEAHMERELQSDGSWVLDGGLHVDVLDELFGVDLGTVPYETLGGLVFSQLGDVPEVGERTETHGLQLEVEAVSERRIVRVRVKAMPPEGVDRETVGRAAFGEAGDREPVTVAVEREPTSADDQERSR